MTVMITRRTLRRTHLLRPDRALNELFVYCLAVLAPRYGIDVHAAVVMSTHEHLIVTDTRGELPRFLHEHHRLFALGVKVLRKWEGAVWDHEKTSVVELRTARAVVEKIAYVIANPVAAGLVRRAHHWPGITLRPEELGRSQWSARRPDFYFDPDNPRWPAAATLTLTMPLLAISEDDARAEVEREVERLEHHAVKELQSKGWKVLSQGAIRRASPYDRATSFEPLRGRNPTFAVGRGQRAAFFEAVRELRAFRNAYRQAFERWRAGFHAAAFPTGTWLMTRVYAAAIA